MSQPYESPDITGHEKAIKAVLRDFLVEASADPNFVVDLAVHEATVYVMKHRPSGVRRVDGAVITPLLREAAEEALNESLKAAAPVENAFVRTVKKLWNRLWRR